MAPPKHIYPTGKPPLLPGDPQKGKRDVDVIQEALDEKEVGVVQLHGTFLLGSQDTLYLRQSLTLRGDDVDKATISGGSWLRWGLRWDHGSQAEVPVPISATVENIVFDGFTGGGIRIGGAVGSNSILGCEFRNYHKGPSSSGKLQGAWPIVACPQNASGGDHSLCHPDALTGTLEIRGCRFGPPVLEQTPTGALVGMNNLVHVNNCFLDSLQIIDNVIEDMCWFGFAVWGVTGKTEIVNNQITLTQKSTYLTPGAAIAFGLRPKSYAMTPDGALRIEGNTITVESPHSYGILVGRYGETEYNPAGSTVQDRDVLVRDNVVHVNGVPTADNAALACCGGCSDASFRFNVVTGSARYGIRVSELSLPLIAPTAANPLATTFIRNTFESFTALRAQMFVGESVSGTSAEENVFGSVSGSNGPDWLSEPHAGIACFGNEGHLVRNDFSKSGIPGWHRGPPIEPVFEQHFGTVPTPVKQDFADPGIGCIFLAESSGKNVVEYDPADFPPGTVPPPGHQILDVFHSGWASIVKKAWMHDNKVLELEHV